MNSDENVMPKQFKSTLQRKHTINHPKPNKQEPKNTKKKMDGYGPATWQRPQWCTGGGEQGNIFV